MAMIPAATKAAFADAAAVSALGGLKRVELLKAIDAYTQKHFERTVIEAEPDLEVWEAGFTWYICMDPHGSLPRLRVHGASLLSGGGRRARLRRGEAPGQYSDEKGETRVSSLLCVRSLSAWWLD